MASRAEYGLGPYLSILVIEKSVYYGFCEYRETQYHLHCVQNWIVTRGSGVAVSMVKLFAQLGSFTLQKR